MSAKKNALQIDPTLVAEKLAGGDWRVKNKTHILSQSYTAQAAWGIALDYLLFQQKFKPDSLVKVIKTGEILRIEAHDLIHRGVREDGSYISILSYEQHQFTPL